MAQRTFLVTLLAAASLAASAAAALIVGPGAAAAVSGVAAAAVRAAGLFLAARSRAEGEASAAALGRLTDALDGGSAPKPTTEEVLPELRPAIGALQGAAERVARFVAGCTGIARTFADGDVPEEV